LTYLVVSGSGAPTLGENAEIQLTLTSFRAKCPIVKMAVSLVDRLPVTAKEMWRASTFSTAENGVDRRPARRHDKPKTFPACEQGACQAYTTIPLSTVTSPRNIASLMFGVSVYVQAAPD
jgi:hypothetical protein